MAFDAADEHSGDGLEPAEQSIVWRQGCRGERSQLIGFTWR